MPKGMFLPGDLTSSARLAIFVSPPYEIKTNPAVAKTDIFPYGIKGTKRCTSTAANPFIM